ncbi:hypothetical protein A6M21_11225 [Desulfotomaculum copahuensis]|uniref:Uncharacterized protein n=1 Tax=Desulfotomaculum copahuensis TaxID=1838280 RepID=A0A1B7LEA2_9FIRM|nr:hypothetical protein A6M21_11225 [Desulfotomaculum copahuensis]
MNVYSEHIPALPQSSEKSMGKVCKNTLEKADRVLDAFTGEVIFPSRGEYLLIGQTGGVGNG